MRHFVLLGVLVISTLVYLGHPTQTHAVRYTSCDACGLCVNSDGTYKKNAAGEEVIPQAWAACVRCLYNPTLPAVGTSPGDFKTFVDAHKAETLQIPDRVSGSVGSGEPPKPLSGKYFTQLGCFDIGSEFDNPNISSSFIGSLLSIIQGIAGAVGFVYLLYGIFLVLTSRGDVVKLKSGQQAIIWAIAGTIFTILAVFVVRFVAVDLLRIPGIQ